MRNLFAFLLLVFTNWCDAQQKSTDSLVLLLPGLTNDTNKVKTLIRIENEYEKEGHIDKALEYSNQAADLSRKLNFKQGIAISLKNNGNIFFNQSNFPRALEYYLNSLKIFEETGDKQGIGRCFGNIGNVYQQMLDYPKSIEYYFKALKIFRGMNNHRVMAVLYNNIGEAYRKQTNYTKALEYFFMGLDVFNRLEDGLGKANCYNNIGIIYTYQGKLQKGLEFYMKALNIRREIGDQHGMGTCYNNLAEVLSKMDKNRLAIQYCDSGLKINRQLGDIELLRTSYENYSGLLNKTGDYKRAYEYYVKFKHLTDTIFSTSNSKKINDLRTTFEVEKKEAEYKHKAEAQQAIANEEKKRQQFVIYLTCVLLLCVLIFAIFMFNRYKITERQKKIIEKQKEIVEESQKQTIDSILYAKRIQNALLTSENYIAGYLKNFLILYKPRNIVSGDFYLAINRNEKFYLATADCTGHGVPGALMSMLGISFLNDIILEKQVEKPNLILDLLRKEIIAALNKEGSESMDGMDISLFCLDMNTLELEYACANNGAYIVRQGELLFLKADKMPVGKHTGNMTSFSYNKIKIQRGDMLYTYTDGYCDQFGGEKGKKFNSKRFESLLLDISPKNLHEQKIILENTFEAWKGQLEQVDDVTVIGIGV